MGREALPPACGRPRVEMTERSGRAAGPRSGVGQPGRRLAAHLRRKPAMKNRSSLIPARAWRMFLSLFVALGLAAALAAATGSARARISTTQAATGTWKLLPAAPAISKPFQVTSVWTGRQMIIHGIFGAFPTRGRFTLAYRPTSRNWARLARGPAWAAVESDDVATWAGSRMLIFGLTNGSYDP